MNDDVRRLDFLRVFFFLWDLLTHGAVRQLGFL